MTIVGHLKRLVLPEPGTGIDQSLHKLLDEFRDTRAAAFAESIHHSATAGAELAMVQQDLRKWKKYAQELERTCMAAGIELPRAPDEE